MGNRMGTESRALLSLSAQFTGPDDVAADEVAMLKLQWTVLQVSINRRTAGSCSPFTMVGRGAKPRNAQIVPEQDADAGQKEGPNVWNSVRLKMKRTE